MSAIISRPGLAKIALLASRENVVSAAASHFMTPLFRPFFFRDGAYREKTPSPRCSCRAADRTHS